MSTECLEHFMRVEFSDAMVVNASILGVGCGSGMTGAALQNAGFKIVDGVDASQGMLNVSKEKNIYRNLIKGRLTDTEIFNIEDGSYDGLLCIGYLTSEHIEVENAIPEFHRLLKHGGIAVYTIAWSLNQINELEKHLRYFLNKKLDLLRIERNLYKENKYFHLYSLKKL